MKRKHKFNKAIFYTVDISDRVDLIYEKYKYRWKFQQSTPEFLSSVVVIFKKEMGSIGEYVDIHVDAANKKISFYWDRHLNGGFIKTVIF